MEKVYDIRENCCGCTACEHICPVNAIGMAEDSEGFLYPAINQETCIDCGKCAEVCAFQKGYDTETNFPIPLVYGVKHKEDGVRKESTSGGAFTALSDAVLEEGGVIYGAAYENQYTVIHKRAEDAEHRNEFRGSKYVQSDLRSVYKEVKADLENGKSVLFSGSGCQVAGLKSFLIKAAVDITNLFSVDFICHGTPSPKVFRDYIGFVEAKRGKEVARHLFRSKAAGWSNREVTVFADGSRDAKSSLSQAYRILFYSDMCLRPACHNCKYANTDRPSDITIGDFWGIEKSHGGFEDDLGISAVLVNTPKGKGLFDKAADTLEYIETELEDCSRYQGNLTRPTRPNPKRDAFWQDYRNRGFEFILRKYSSYGLIRRVRLLIFTLMVKIKLLNAIKKLIKR